MTYHGLAETILKESDKPLTANEIWQIAIDKKLDNELESKGQTPWATLGARLYVIAKDNPTSIFATIGQRPKRFYLKNKKYDNLEVFAEGVNEIDTKKDLTKNEPFFLEKDLHPFLSYYAFWFLKCMTKTINHSSSGKKEFGEWVHPDIVGCIFPEWEDEVIKLSSSIGNTSIKLLSFELKRELNLSTLRESFFQAVSNSSWANESYLVAAKISPNDDFLSELSRLSTSFGIGVISLDINDPNSSKTLYPAKSRDFLDFETINKLTMNKDFREFLKRIRIDLESHEVRKEKYDIIHAENFLIDSIKK